jgi:RNA polymerase sigma factor (sigma-70 family)
MAKSSTAAKPTRRQPGDGPYFVHDPSFDETGAEARYTRVPEEHGTERTQHMTDDVTREVVRAMHYAAYRQSKARTEKERQKWGRLYYAHRDRVVMGNHKLVYRAVSRWMPPSQYAEDMTSDCHVVLIQAVAAYNPWMGIRFSTYAFTCLMRALSRLSQRHANDKLSRSLTLESLPDGEPHDRDTDEPPTARLQRIDEFLNEGNELLSPREKLVLIMRFCLDDRPRCGTLEQVGREIGLSKERVRQVQAGALAKIRNALLEGQAARS